MVLASMQSLKSHTLDPVEPRSKPKVLFVSEQMPLGGGSTSILNLCEGFRKDASWDPHVTVFESLHSIGAQIKARGIPVFGPCSGAIYEDRVSEMLEFCRRIQPQAIVAALGGSAFDFFRFVPTGCFRVAMIQSDDPNVYEQVIRYSPWIDVVAGVSKEICRKAKEFLGSTDIAVSYQPYGVPMPKTPSVPIRSKNLRVLYLGRLYEEQKRVSLMERTIRATLKSKFDIQWTIAGDGSELHRLRKNFANHKKQVSFLGEITYDHVQDIFTNNDVYFLCSDYEGLPLSMLEAMGAGLVPVVSDLPSGISEVVNSQNGMRIPVESESGYLDALLSLAANRGLLDAMSVESIAAVRTNFSIEAMTDRWLAMINAGCRGTIDWKKNVPVRAPLQLQHKLAYHPFFKFFRRFYKILKKRFGHTIAAVQP
jgi:glycosyltransferase involved in cell wall biosynthesis